MGSWIQTSDPCLPSKRCLNLQVLLESSSGWVLNLKKNCQRKGKILRNVANIGQHNVLETLVTNFGKCSIVFAMTLLPHWCWHLLQTDGESKCADGLRSCGLIDHQKEMCVHESLWCDHHINCGQPHNQDEMSCFNSYGMYLLHLFNVGVEFVLLFLSPV